MIASHQGAELAKTSRMRSRTGTPHTRTERRTFFRDCAGVVCWIPTTPLAGSRPVHFDLLERPPAMHGSLRDVDAADDHGQSALQSAVSSYGNASAKQQGDWTTGYERARDRQGEL